MSTCRKEWEDKSGKFGESFDLGKLVGTESSVTLTRALSLVATLERAASGSSGSKSTGSGSGSGSNAGGGSGSSSAWQKGGSWSNKRPAADSWNSSQNKKACYQCKGWGHQAKDCPEKY